MIHVVLFCNIEHSKTTHTFEMFPFKNTIREQSVTLSLHRETICVVLVVGSTPRCCAVYQLPRKEKKMCDASSKPCLTIVALISRIFIEFEFQVVLVDFATVVIACLFGHLEGYSFLCCLGVLVIAVYCLDVFVIACGNHEVISSLTIEVVGFTCLIHKVVSSLVYFLDVLVVAVYFLDVLVIAIYFYGVIFIAIYFPDDLVIAVYFPAVLVIAVYFPDVLVIAIYFPAIYFIEVVSSVRCDRFSG
jgi:hypothetical protein